MKRRILAALLLTMILFSLTACGASEPAAGSEEAGSAVLETPEPLKLIGEKAEGEHVFHLTLKNATGKDIVSFAVQAEGDEGEPENMLAQNDSFAAGESRELWYDGSAAFAALEQSQAEGEAERTPEFTLVMKLSDETTQEVHAFPFGDTEACELCLEGDLAYVIYQSAETKQTVNTKDAEQSVRDLAAKAKAEAEAKAKAEAEAAAAAEAARQQAAAAEAARQQAAAAEAARQQQQQQPSQPTQDEPAPDDGGDGCIDDGIMY